MHSIKFIFYTILLALSFDCHTISQYTLGIVNKAGWIRSKDGSVSIQSASTNLAPEVNVESITSSSRMGTALAPHYDKPHEDGFISPTEKIDCDESIMSMARLLKKPFKA